MGRRFIAHDKLIADLIKELRLTADELDRALKKGDSLHDLLADIERRHTIHSGLTLRVQRKLRATIRSEGADPN